MAPGKALDVMLEIVTDYLDNFDGNRSATEDLLGSERAPQLRFIAALRELGYDETADHVEETLGL